MLHKNASGVLMSLKWKMNLIKMLTENLYTTCSWRRRRLGVVCESVNKANGIKLTRNLFRLFCCFVADISADFIMIDSHLNACKYKL